MTATRADVWEALLANRERAARVALARGVRPDDVEDCVQEAMARVAAMPEVDLRRVGSLVTVVVANLAADKHRARTRRDRLERRLAGTQLLAEPSHDDAVCDRHEARWLWSLRRGLGEQDRRVLELRAQGQSLADTAAELGVTYKAAENSLGRARRRLRTASAATAAVLGVLLGRRPRQPGLVLASVPVALVGLVGLAVLSPAPPTAVPSPGPGGADAAVVRTQTPPRPAAGSAEPQARRAPTPSAPAPSARRAAAGPAQAPPAPVPGAGRRVESRSVKVMDGGVTVDVIKDDDDRPFVEEVQRCLREGPVVSLEMVGCPP